MDAKGLLRAGAASALAFLAIASLLSALVQAGSLLDPPSWRAARVSAAALEVGRALLLVSGVGAVACASLDAKSRSDRGRFFAFAALAGAWLLLGGRRRSFAPPLEGGAFDLLARAVDLAAAALLVNALLAGACIALAWAPGNRRSTAMGAALLTFGPFLAGIASGALMALDVGAGWPTLSGLRATALLGTLAFAAGALFSTVALARAAARESRGGSRALGQGTQT